MDNEEIKEVNELLDKLGKLEKAPLIWINKKFDMPNIINELEDWLKQKCEELHQQVGDNWTTVGQSVYKETLDKLQELKGKYNNV